MRYTTYNIAGSDVSIPSPESYADCATLIKSDSYRHNGRHDSTADMDQRIHTHQHRILVLVQARATPQRMALPYSTTDDQTL